MYFFAQQVVLKAIDVSSLYCAFSGFEKYETDNSEKVFLLPRVKIDPTILCSCDFHFFLIVLAVTYFHSTLDPPPKALKLKNNVSFKLLIQESRQAHI